MDQLNCGIFWDIENVAVPWNCDAAGIVSTIRSTIIEPNNLEERDFFVVCNVNQIPSSVGKSLESMRVNIVQPFYEQSDNAADTKILLLISKFIKNWGERGCAIVVVTGDSDFLDPLLKLKLNYELDVYLIHGKGSFSRDLLWSVDVSYQMNGGTLRETSPRLRYCSPSGFLELSGLYEDSESYKRVYQINATCNRIKAGTRVLRVAKGTVWIGHTDPRQAMTEDDLQYFLGIKFLGCIPQVKLVSFLWANSQAHKFKVNNQSPFRDQQYTAGPSNHIRLSSSPSNRNFQSSIGVTVSTGHGTRRQFKKYHVPGNDINTNCASLRITGPPSFDNSSPFIHHSANRRERQPINHKNDKNETHIRLPRVS